MAIDKICPLPKNNNKLRANISEDEPLAYFFDDFSIKDESMIGMHSVSPKSQLSNNRERGKYKFICASLDPEINRNNRLH